MNYYLTGALWTNSPEQLLLQQISWPHAFCISAGKLTDLNHIGSHLPALHVSVVNDDGVSTPFKSLLGYGIKLAQERQSKKNKRYVVLVQLRLKKTTTLKRKQWSAKKFWLATAASLLLKTVCVFTSFLVPLMSFPQNTGVKLIFSMASEIVVSGQFNCT